MKYFLLLLFFSQLSFSQQSISTDSMKIDETMLLKNIQVISHDSLEGRGFGSPGNYKTQQFIAAQFDNLGIQPAFDSLFIQQFPYTFKGARRQRMYPLKNHELDKIPDTTIIGGNVVAKITGSSEKTIVITGHLDHLGIRDGQIYNGADDDASGTAALLSIAAYFKERTLNHTLILAAVDAEEIGSLGAEYLLNNFPLDTAQIVLNINMDMIAHNDSLQLYASGLYHSPNLKKPLAAIKSKIDLKFGHDDPENKEMDDWTNSSDHRIFHNAGIPFIYFGVEDHKDYHKPTDTFENINTEFYIEAVKLIIATIASYDEYLVEN